MSQVDKMDLLSRWWQLSQQLKQIKEQEIELRREVAKYFFPEPITGTNRESIGNGYDLVMDYKLTNTFDIEGFRTVCDENPDLMDFYDVIDVKEVFNEKAFKEMEEGSAKDVVASFRTSKPASPSLDIKKESEKKKPLYNLFANGYRFVEKELNQGSSLEQIMAFLNHYPEQDSDYIKGAYQAIDELYKPGELE